jgi:hypothetical protein
MRRLGLIAIVACTACSSSSGDSNPGDDATSDAGDDGDAAMIDSIVATDSNESGVDAPPDGETSSTRTLDCTWAKDPKNCWRAFVKAVDVCLGNFAGADVVGTMSADGTSCTFDGTAESGRSVSFARPLDPFTASADRDFLVMHGGSATTVCLHYVEHAATTGFTVTGPTGTLSYAAKGNDVTIVCPDGSAFEGDAEKIAIACGEAIINGGVPGDDIESPPDRFKLSGSVDWDFQCAAPGSDGGVDGDGSSDGDAPAD